MVHNKRNLEKLVLGGELVKHFSFFSNRWGSGTIRGSQVAERIGGKLNPASDYENDICIFIKKLPFLPFPKNSFLDVIDDITFIRWLKDHPDMGVIAFTKPSRDHIAEILDRSDVVYIPQHHCNFERHIRPKREVKLVGCNGSKFVLGHNEGEAREMFHKVGLDFVNHVRPSSRRGVVGFHKSIDIHICFRPKMKHYNFKDSLKIVNAGSYGVPTVAFPEPNNELEFKDCYVPVTSFKELVDQCERLKCEPDYYNEIAEKVLKKSEAYHIDNIIPRYRELEAANES